jgi:hypothetical protein
MDVEIKRTINISSLKKLITEDGLEIITVFGNGGKVDLCSGIDYGKSPYQYFLNLEGNAEILSIREASPIWQNLLEGIEKRRPIYKIYDPESDGWIEIVLYEK